MVASDGDYNTPGLGYTSTVDESFVVCAIYVRMHVVKCNSTLVFRQLLAFTCKDQMEDAAVDLFQVLCTGEVLAVNTDAKNFTRVEVTAKNPECVSTPLYFVAYFLFILNIDLSDISSRNLLLYLELSGQRVCWVALL